MTPKKLRRPDRSGWWDWHEGRERFDPARILVGNGGKTVASDEAWELNIGRKPSEIMCENYWEGTDTTQRYMPGYWVFVKPAKFPPDEE
jgi:hypothetical protein